MSGIRSILVHVDHSAHVSNRIAAAIGVGERLGATVNVQYCVMRGVQLYPMAGMPVHVQQSIAESDGQRRRATRNIVANSNSAACKLQWSEDAVSGPAEFAARARYADLCILGQENPDDDQSADIWSGFVTDVIVDSGQPSLVLPWIPLPDVIGRRIVIAWKNTRESARAVTAALPFLSMAEEVHLVGCGQHAHLELAALQGRLERHDIRASLCDLAEDEREVGEALLSVAGDRGADLLVMGCYGHSRAREWMAGGTTKSILRAMTVPVLMSH